jgi:hypothetical protein
VSIDRKRARSPGSSDCDRHFRGGANRGKRVLELVRDIAREALRVANVLVEPPGQLLQGAREIPDLVPAIRVGEPSRQLIAVAPRARGLTP